MEWTKEQMEALYASTNEAISKVAGIPVPADFRICIVEQDPAYQATFLLPPMLPEDVSDEDLEAVAGGDCVQDIDVCGVQGCGARGK